MRPLRMIRYGTTAEQKFVDEFKDDFDLLVINGNMISHASSAISKFVASRQMDYVIDPMTHSIQHDIQHIQGKNGEIKSSIKKMLDNYPDFAKEKVLNQHKVLVPSDFDEENRIKEFTRSVIEFQEHHVIKHSQEKDYFKYLEYLEIDFKPKWIVAPYFMMNSRNLNRWLDINIKMVEYATGVVEEQRLAAQIVIEQDLLTDLDDLQHIVDSYEKSGIKNILLWVDDFSAFEASPNIIDNFGGFIKKFSDRDISVYNLYGDYYSVLLCHSDCGQILKGVCHGIEYGEKRAIVPVGGGIPVNKFYLYPVHQRIDYGRVATLLRLEGILPNDLRRFYDEICNCQSCHDTIGSDLDNFSLYGESNPVEINRKHGKIVRQFPTTEAKARCVRHFLYNKIKEWDELENINIEELLSYSIVKSESFADILGYDIAENYKLWHRKLTKIKGE